MSAVVRSPRCAIVTTTAAPPAIIEPFLRYHLGVGFERIYAFFDDPADPYLARAAATPGVVAVVCDAALRESQTQLPLWDFYGPHVDYEVMARQCLNVLTAMRMALADGMDWLLHIDSDETFLVDDLTAHFASIPAAAGQVSYANYEGVPETLEIKDHVSEITLYKRPEELVGQERVAQYRALTGRPSYFLGYVIGKAAARVTAETRPHGVNRFRRLPAHPELVEVVGQPCVLHAIDCGLENYRRKYEQLGKFADAWWGGTNPIPLEFHLRSRDALAAGGSEGLVEIYKRDVLIDDPALIETLLEAGILIRLSPATHRRPR